jgi:hypothetical protein
MNGIFAKVLAIFRNLPICESASRENCEGGATICRFKFYEREGLRNIYLKLDAPKDQRRKIGSEHRRLRLDRDDGYECSFVGARYIFR